MHRQSFRRRSKLQLCSCMLRPGVAKTWKKSGLKILGLFEFCDVNFPPLRPSIFPPFWHGEAPRGCHNCSPKGFWRGSKVAHEKNKIDVFCAFDEILSSDYPPVSKYFPLILAWGGPQGLPQLFPKRILMLLESCSTKHFFGKFADFFACGSSFGPSWPSRWEGGGNLA